MYSNDAVVDDRLDEAQLDISFHLESIVTWKIVNNFRYTDNTTLMSVTEEELKSFSMKVKEVSEKAGLKLNIQKTKIMAYSPITSWQVDGETIEIVTDFIFLGPKITADSEYNFEIKRHVVLLKEVITNLDSILKRRDLTLLTKVYIVKAVVFPAVMYGFGNWTIKKAEHQRLILLNCGVGEDS